jgi:hypothetical protein
MTSLEVAIAEAERFLERAKALQAWRESALKNNRWASDNPTLSALARHVKEGGIPSWDI